jgi:hypothetical protein
MLLQLAELLEAWLSTMSEVKDQNDVFALVIRQTERPSSQVGCCKYWCGLVDFERWFWHCRARQQAQRRWRPSRFGG